jgi:hypothetical protein
MMILSHIPCTPRFLFSLFPPKLARFQSSPKFPGGPFHFFLGIFLAGPSHQAVRPNLAHIGSRLHPSVASTATACLTGRHRCVLHPPGAPREAEPLHRPSPFPHQADSPSNPLPLLLTPSKQVELKPTSPTDRLRSPPSPPRPYKRVQHPGHHLHNSFPSSYPPLLARKAAPNELRPPPPILSVTGKTPPPRHPTPTSVSFAESTSPSPSFRCKPSCPRAPAR